MKFRKKPVVIEAILWGGGGTDHVDDFCGQPMWGRADVHEVPWDHPDKEQLVIYNHLEKAWIPCPIGHWIIRGVRGELYPCEPRAFEATYEAVD